MSGCYQYLGSHFAHFLNHEWFRAFIASTLIFFTYQILDDSFCEASHSAGLLRDMNNPIRYAQFLEHFHHVLDVPKIERVAVHTAAHCVLRCLNNDRCFSANTGAFHQPNGNISCDLLPTDKYNSSEKFKANYTFHHYSIMVGIKYISSSYVVLLLQALR